MFDRTCVKPNVKMSPDDFRCSTAPGDILIPRFVTRDVGIGLIISNVNSEPQVFWTHQNKDNFITVYRHYETLYWIQAWDLVKAEVR